MINLPNLLSLLRLPLALLFLYDESTAMRSFVLFLALVTDGLDGFLARRFRQSSWLGTLLDPIMDKFFVCIVLFVFIRQNSVSPAEAAALLSRDIAVLLYGCFLITMGRLSSYEFRAIWCGKVTTCLQFAVFMALLLGMAIPVSFYGLFVGLGILALVELYLFDRSAQTA